MKIDAGTIKAECKIDLNKFNNYPKSYIIDNTKYEQQRTLNSYHRYWECIRNYSKIVFPKFKHNSILKFILNKIFKKYNNQKIKVIRTIITKNKIF